MTLDDAFDLQHKWIAKFVGKICSHDEQWKALLSKKKQDTGYKVCPKCGEVFLDPCKQLTLAEFKALVLRYEDEDFQTSRGNSS